MTPFVTFTLPTVWASASPSSELAYSALFYKKPRYPDGRVSFSCVNVHAPKGGRYCVGVVASFDTFYPYFLEGTCAAGEHLLSVRLFTPSLEEDLIAYPYLAQTMAVEETAKNIHVTFTLHPKACFSNGIAITAEDVVFSNAFLEKTSFWHRQQFSRHIQKVFSPKKGVVVFVLEKNCPKEMPHTIATQHPILSKAFHTTWNVEKKGLTPPISGGPYRIGGFSPGRFVVYERQKDWWGSSLPAFKGRFNFDHIRYEFFKDEQVCFEAFKAKETDCYIERKILHWIKGYHFPAVKRKEVLKLELPHQLPLGHPCFILNTRHPLLKDIRVRKALNLLFDFQWLNGHLFFHHYQRVASCFENTPFKAQGPLSLKEKNFLKTLPKNFSEKLMEKAGGSEAISLQPFSQRRLQALELLSSAGWVAEKGTLVHPVLGPFQLSCMTQGKTLDKVLYFFKKCLKKVGIRLDIVQVDPSVWMEKERAFDFQMVPGVFCISHIPGEELNTIYQSASAHQPGSFNLAGVEDPWVDMLIQKILSCKTMDQLVTVSHVLDRYLMAGHYTIPQWTYPFLMVAVWNRFGRPNSLPLQGLDMDSWWDASASPITIDHGLGYPFLSKQ